MVKKPSLRDRFRYWFDNRFSGGSLVVIGWLAIGTFVLVLIMTALSMIPGIHPEGLDVKELFWTILSQALTPNPYDPAVRWQFLVVMLVVTLGSLLIVSILIGTLTNSISEKLDELRKGRSRVLENDHTLILGWSPQVFTILSELMHAFECHKGAHIVVLADKDKVEMEDEIRARVKTINSTHIICRRGNPLDIIDLEIANPHSARAIIILPPESNDPDAVVIKTILALTNNPNRSTESYHIVTQIHEPKNMDVVKMISERDQVQAVLTGDMIARVIAQTSRQSGLSLVYTEFLNFEGDEIYFKEEPDLVGKPFSEALSAYEDSTVIGLHQADGKIKLMPPMEAVIAQGDQIIAISEDDETVTLSRQTDLKVDESALRPISRQQAMTENTLIVGWNRIGLTIIRELDAYAARGSRLVVVADPEASPKVAHVEDVIAEIAPSMHNQQVSFRKGDTTSRALLDTLDLGQFDHVIVLSYAGLETQEADARTLVTLLHLRHIAEREGTPFSVVSEMLDLRNSELAAVAHVDDFIVSEHLVSLMMAQLSENGDLYDIFTDIFDPVGPEIYLKPISDYIVTGRPVNFHTLVEAARRRGEIAIGYRILHELNDKEKTFGIHTNPTKSEQVTFAQEDRIIVVADEQVGIYPEMNESGAS
jgi:voltage-gated potassium channel Kch